MSKERVSSPRVEAYLVAVEQQLAYKPEAVRREIVAGLREHIGEALRGEGAQASDTAAVERVLAAMDAPEEFAETAEAQPEGGGGMTGAVAGGGARGGGRWFWLALALVGVNAYGVWRWTHPVSTPESAALVREAAMDVTAPVGQESLPPAPEPLRLLAVEQADVSASREVTLRLQFDAVPDEDRLPNYLRLFSDSEPILDYVVRGSEGSRTVWVLTRSVPDRELHYFLREGMPARTGAGGTSQRYEGVVVLTPEFHLRRLTAEAPSFDAAELRAEFSTFPELSGMAAFLEVDPAVTFRVERSVAWGGGRIRLVGDFRPGGIYSVTFKAGLPAENGSKLEETITRLVQFPDRSPGLRIDTEGRYLSPQGPLTVPIRMVNQKSWTASLRPVFENNLVHLALRERDGWQYYGRTTDDLTGAAVTLTNAVSALPNAETRVALALTELMPDPRGVLLLEAGNDRRLLVVTDLGIVARLFRGGALVWVNALASGKASAGVEVVVHARNNQVLARGLTDDQGLARLEGWDGEEPFLITARKDGDLSYLDLSGASVNQGEGLEGAAYLTAGTFEAAVFTERGVYRPDETVFMQALVRDDALRAPGAFPALFRVRRPDGRIFKDLPVMLDGHGAAQATVVLPAFLPTGRYTLELAMPGTYTILGSTTVALEDFVPPQIRVEVTAPEQGQAGQVQMFRVRGEHLFGRVATGLPVTGAVTVKPAPFAPEAWKDWHFGDDEQVFASIYRALGKQTLGVDGSAEFVFETSSAWRPPAALQLVQQATVLESGGRAVSAYGSTRLDVYPFYIGLRRSWEGALRVGETQRVAVVAVLPDGGPVAEGRPLSVGLYLVQWHSVLREVRGGRYEWKSEREATLVREDNLVAGGTPVDWAFAVDRMGDYMLQVRDPASGASSRIPMVAASPEQQWVSWSREKPGRVELTWDRERYRPGEVARLLVKSPFSGTALLTIETDRVRTARVVELEKNTAELEIPVEAGYAPNVYCTLTVIRAARAESVWSPHRAVGAVALPVELPLKRLAVSIEAPAQVRPQSRLTVRLGVRDEAGQPVRGAVTLMAVDEGICLLTAFEPPDPNRVFLAQRGLGVQLWDLYHDLMPVLEDAVTGIAAAGGDEGSGLRRRLNPIKAKRFKPVALWQADVALDADGRAVVELEVPEFTGTLRLMAVAYNADQAGAGRAGVVVKRELVAQPNLPRFMALGDVAEGSVSLFNEGAETLPIRVLVTSGGPLRVEPAEQVLDLGAGQSAVVPLRLEAGPGPGLARCRLEVVGGVDRYVETVELPVRPAVGLGARMQGQVLAAGAAVTLAPPADWLEATVSQELAISALSDLQLAGALAYLRDYPHGCLEQTVSSAFPRLHAEALLPRLQPGATAVGDLGALVRAAVMRVLSMQQADGGFALWPFENGTAVGASLYAVHFLVEARAAGFDVPADRLEAALGWLSRQLEQRTPPEVGTDVWRDDMGARAYACHLLALAGRPDVGWIARLRDQSAMLDAAARTHVAAALLLAGEPRQAVAILEALGMPTPRERVPGRPFDGHVRDAALLLSVWVDIDPANPAVEALAQFLLAAQREGHWDHTHDNALVLLAFGKRARLARAAPLPFSGLLTMPDGSQQPFASTQDLQWVRSPGEGGAVTITNQGPGPLYWWCRQTGVPIRPAPEVAQGVEVERAFLNAAGQPLDVRTLAQGELVIVRITVDARGRSLDQMVIEDLLPAGWEIENPNLVTSRAFGWLDANTQEAVRYRDARDDRMLFFTGALSQRHRFHYAARAVTPGVYTYPAVTVSGMYAPEIRAVRGGMQVIVKP